jgi:hypothetical protein
VPFPIINSMQFSVIGTRYAITASPLLTSYAMYLETHKLIVSPNGKFRLGNAIPELTVIYFWDNIMYPNGQFSLQFKPPGKTDHKQYANVLIGQTYVNVFWDYIRNRELTQLELLAGTKKNKADLIFEGVSQAFSFEEALKDAISKDPKTDAGTDIFDYEVLETKCEFGGFALTYSMRVKIKRIERK